MLSGAPDPSAGIRRAALTSSGFPIAMAHRTCPIRPSLSGESTSTSYSWMASLSGERALHVCVNVPSAPPFAFFARTEAATMLHVLDPITCASFLPASFQSWRGSSPQACHSAAKQASTIDLVLTIDHVCSDNLITSDWFCPIDRVCSDNWSHLIDHVCSDICAALHAWKQCHKTSIFFSAYCCPSCSSKLEKLLALGSPLMVEQSGYRSFYQMQLRPFEHYVPFWWVLRVLLWTYCCELTVVNLFLLCAKLLVFGVCMKLTVTVSVQNSQSWLPILVRGWFFIMSLWKPRSSYSVSQSFFALVGSYGLFVSKDKGKS